MRDRDTKYQRPFDATFKSAGTEVKVGAFRSPNTNAYVERFIQTIQQECLDHFVVFGQEHMDYLVDEFVIHYHEERPQQSKNNEPLRPREPSANIQPQSGEDDHPIPLPETIECRQRLGGLLKHYCRQAA